MASLLPLDSPSILTLICLHGRRFGAGCDLRPSYTATVSTEGEIRGPVRVGVVGLGYWGPNLARNFDRLPDAELRWLCDASEEARARAGAQLPGVRQTGELDELLADPDLDAVVVATHVPSHPELSTRVLEAGKHCFVEKPLAQSSAEAEQVADAARDAGRVLMVGHLLEYHPGDQKLK